MIITESNTVPLDKCPALVLNADYRPLSYYPLSLWCWQDAVRDVFLDRVTIVSEYDREIRSPSFTMKLPSVISLKKYIKPSEFPNFTRFNVFLRDKFSCQYCGSQKNLTFDHVIPRSKGRYYLLGKRCICLLYMQCKKRRKASSCYWNDSKNETLSSNSRRITS